MILLGAVALVANAVSLRLLHEGQAESLNVRGAYLEVLGDLLGSAAVVVAGVVVLVAGWVRADAVASLLIAALIAPRAFALLREAVHVLAEGAPRGLDLEQLRAHLAGVPGVVDVHDLHVWTITSGMPVLSAHVVVSDAVVDRGRLRRRERARPAGRLRGRPLRRRAQHVPDRARRPRRARAHSPARVTTAPATTAPEVR